MDNTLFLPLRAQKLVVEEGSALALYTLTASDLEEGNIYNELSGYSIIGTLMLRSAVMKRSSVQRPNREGYNIDLLCAWSSIKGQMCL